MKLRHKQWKETRLHYYLTGEAQVFEEPSQGLVQICELGHAVLTFTAVLIAFKRIKVLTGHGVFVFTYILPIGEQLREVTPRIGRHKINITEQCSSFFSLIVAVSYTPLIKILGDKKVQEAELQFRPILLLLQQPGELICNTPGHAVLATHSVNTLNKKSSSYI